MSETTFYPWFLSMHYSPEPLPLVVKYKNLISSRIRRFQSMDQMMPFNKILQHFQTKGIGPQLPTSEMSVSTMVFKLIRTLRAEDTAPW